MYILHLQYLVGEMGLGQAVQDCTLICTYDQLFELHCTADWHQHCQPLKEGLRISLSFARIKKCQKTDPLKIEKLCHLLF